MIILKRIDSGMEDLLRENQCGFRRNRSCIDQIYALRTIIHNCLEFNIPMCINFVDFKAAFESIRRDFIWTSMRHYWLPQKYIRIFQAFFNGTMSAARVNGELTDWFIVNSGTGRGDIQGPPVFNFCLNFAAYMAETGAVDYGGCDYGECDYGGFYGECYYGECEYGGCDYGECDYGGFVSVRGWPMAYGLGYGVGYGLGYGLWYGLGHGLVFRGLGMGYGMG